MSKDRHISLEEFRADPAAAIRASMDSRVILEGGAVITTPGVDTPFTKARALVDLWGEDSGIHEDYYSTLSGKSEDLLVERIAEALSAAVERGRGEL